MRWVHVLRGAVILLAVCSPAIASGHHISCQFGGVVVEQNDDKENVSRTLNFYLDDTAEKLVPEGGGSFPLSAKTTMYADTEIVAEIHDGGMAGGDLFLFRHAMQPPAVLTIYRTTGRAALAAKLTPKGADVEAGDCREISSPATRF